MSKKRIVISAILIILILPLGISGIINYTDPTLHESIFGQNSNKLTYEQTLVKDWDLNMKICEGIDSLEELQDFGEDVGLEMETLDYEISEYVKSTKSVNLIKNSMDQISKCIDKKTQEFG